MKKKNKNPNLLYEDSIQFNVWLNDALLKRYPLLFHLYSTAQLNDLSENPNDWFGAELQNGYDYVPYKMHRSNYSPIMQYASSDGNFYNKSGQPISDKTIAATDYLNFTPKDTYYGGMLPEVVATLSLADISETNSVPGSGISYTFNNPQALFATSDADLSGVPEQANLYRQNRAKVKENMNDLQQQAAQEFQSEHPVLYNVGRGLEALEPLTPVFNLMTPSWYVGSAAEHIFGASPETREKLENSFAPLDFYTSVPIGSFIGKGVKTTVKLGKKSVSKLKSLKH